MRNNYGHVALPEQILRKVDSYIKKDIFYRSRAEFVKHAIQEKFDRIERL